MSKNKKSPSGQSGQENKAAKASADGSKRSKEESPKAKDTGTSAYVSKRNVKGTGAPANNTLKYVGIALVVGCAVVAGAFLLLGGDDEKAEYDLTKMTDSARQALTDNIASNPSKYAGKTIKMDGTYNFTGRSITMSDPAGCCTLTVFYLEGDDETDGTWHNKKIQVFGTYEYKSGKHTIVLTSIKLI